MEGNVVNNLCSLPATDLNFTSELNRATAYQIKQAIEKMKQNGGKNKGRIKACERELENRRLTKKDKNGKFAFMTADSVLKLIENQPTAYDVDKVVKQLEAYSNADEAERLGTMPVVELADAIKIVKGGGVNG